MVSETSCLLPGTPGLLPSAGDRTWIAIDDACLQLADIDAELQCIRTDNTADAAVSQPFLNLTALLRQISTAIATNRLARQASASLIPQIGKQNLYSCSAPREDNRLNALIQQERCQLLRFQHTAAANAKLLIDDRGIIEDKVLLSSWRTILINELYSFPQSSRSACSFGLSIVADAHKN